MEIFLFYQNLTLSHPPSSVVRTPSFPLALSTKKTIIVSKQHQGEQQEKYLFVDPYARYKKV